MLGSKIHIDSCRVSALPSPDESAKRYCDSMCKKYRYEDSMIVIVEVSETTLSKGVGVRRKPEEDNWVFMAEYSDMPSYTSSYSVGKHLEPREGGGYEIIEDTSEYQGGGFKEKIDSYIPGDWENHLLNLYREVKTKRDSEEIRRKQKIEEDRRKGFGL
jgi:hypothetical protein